MKEKPSPLLKWWGFAVGELLDLRSLVSVSYGNNDVQQEGTLCDNFGGGDQTNVLAEGGGGQTNTELPDRVQLNQSGQAAEMGYSFQYFLEEFDIFILIFT